MAKIKQGILGGFSGSVANVVGTSWKGLAVMKSKPLSVANPRTLAQTQQRTKFKAGSALASKVRTAVMYPFWNHLAQYMSGANLWMRENLPFINVDGTVQGLALSFSKGSIGPQVGLACIFNAVTLKFEVEWTAATLPANGSDDDQVSIIILADDGDVIGLLPLGTVQRDQVGHDIELRVAGTPVDEYTCHFITKSADNSRQSEDAKVIGQVSV